MPDHLTNFRDSLDIGGHWYFFLGMATAIASQYIYDLDAHVMIRVILVAIATETAYAICAPLIYAWVDKKMGRINE